MRIKTDNSKNSFYACFFEGMPGQNKEAGQPYQNWSQFIF